MRPKPTMPHPLVLQVMGAGRHLADVPSAAQDFLVGRDVVADQRQDLHHHVLGDADHVAAGDFGHGDAMLGGGGQVEVVRADAGGEQQLEVGSGLNALPADVGGPERGGDQNVGGGQMTVKPCACVGGGHQLVSGPLQPLPQPQGVLGATQQFGRLSRRCSARI